MPQSTPSNLSVWIVDDDEDDQLFIRSAFLRVEPAIHVVSLYDGEELLPALATCEELPRLILLDINMPRQNGFETLAQLRNSPTFANLSVVMLTTSTADEDRLRSLALGAVQFLTKPATRDELIALARELSQEWVLY